MIPSQYFHLNPHTRDLLAMSSHCNIPSLTQMCTIASSVFHYHAITMSNIQVGAVPSVFIFVFITVPCIVMGWYLCVRAGEQSSRTELPVHTTVPPFYILPSLLEVCDIEEFLKESIDWVEVACYVAANRLGRFYRTRRYLSPLWKGEACIRLCRIIWSRAWICG